ncbi:MAG: hypothetical protein JXQ73_14220 [Phycisphaerae bacterium]|nr:hypothetical protein [Phycisphaerae bacterium]
MSRRLAIACCLIGLGASGLLAALSKGTHHDDDLTHYLYAKWAANRPAYLLHEWGRPGFTVPYFLPAQLGWVAARWFSGLLTILAAWLAYRIAEEIHLPHAWLVAPMALIQPMFFQLSYTTLTETPLAFYVTLGVWLLVTRRFGWSALVFSAALVTRHESVVWLPIWLLAMWHGRARWWCYPWLIWAPVAHNLLAPGILGKIPILMFLEPTADVQYGRGSLVAMLGRALLAYGPGLSALACLGVPMVCRRRRGWIVAGVIVVYFGFHMVCRYLGVYATGGYPRFLIPISPMVAIAVVAAICGLIEWTADRWWLRAASVAAAFVLFWFAGEWEKPWWIYPPFLLAFRLVTAGVVVVSAATIWVRLTRPRLKWVRWLIPTALVSMTIVQTAYLSRPWPRTAEQRSVAEVVTWLKQHGYGDRTVYASNVWVHYLWPIELDPGDWHTRQALDKAPPGTVLIWDRRYSPAFPQEMPLEEYLDDPNYRLLTKSYPSPGVFCYVFEKRGG